MEVSTWGNLLMTLFRERLLARLLDRHAISPEQRLEDTAAYLDVRNPLSLQKLVCLDGRQAVLTAPA